MTTSYLNTYLRVKLFKLVVCFHDHMLWVRCVHLHSKQCKWISLIYYTVLVDLHLVPFFHDLFLLLLFLMRNWYFDTSHLRWVTAVSILIHILHDYLMMWCRGRRHPEINGLFFTVVISVCWLLLLLLIVDGFMLRFLIHCCSI